MCLQSRNTYNVKSLKQRKSFELFGPIKSDRVIVKIVWHTYCQIPAIFCYTQSSCYGNYITPWISRNLPKPECSTELNITTASIFPVYFPENYYEILMGP
jgi:hypothetical protein